MPSTYPKFDCHAHLEGPKGPYVEAFDHMNVRRALNVSYGNFWAPARIQEYEEALLEEATAFPDRFLFCSSFSLHGFEEPGYLQRTIEKLSRDLSEHAAVAVKLWKSLGMQLRDAAGDYVFCDDPRLMPILDFLAAQNVVIMMHIGDPKAAWLPLDSTSPHYGYYRNNPQFHWYGKPGRPSHEEILAHRDRLIGLYPNTRFLCCHLGSLAHDVAEVSALLDRFPNAQVDVAARHQDLERQPHKAVHEFFLAYQDRIHYGTDWETSQSTSLRTGHAQRDQALKWAAYFEPIFSYYEKKIRLPAEVLEKFYHRNSSRLFGIE